MIFDFDEFCREIGLDDIESEVAEMERWEHAIVMTAVYNAMARKKGEKWTKDQFKRFFSLTDEEVEVILDMWKNRGRTINSGKKDGYDVP